MSVDTKNWTVQDWLNVAPASGLPPSNFVPESLRATCASIAQKHKPASSPANFVTACTACLIARGLIIWKNSPGDCGSPTQVDYSDVQAVQSIASGISQMAGASLPGIGAAVKIVTDIFAHHDQAVANEQATNCAVANIVNSVLNHYDRLVANGNMSPSTAYAGMQSYLGQVRAKLATIEKTCNAACVWAGVVDAHSDFVQTYYPALAPVGFFSHAPGAPPSNFGTAPGGVIQVGGGLAASLPSGSGSVSGGLTISTNELILGLGALVLIFVLIAVMK